MCKYVKTRQPSEDFSPPFEHIQHYPINGRIVLLVAVLHLLVVLVIAISVSFWFQLQSSDSPLRYFEQHEREDNIIWTLYDSTKEDQLLHTNKEKQDRRTLNYHPPPQIEIVDSYLLTVHQEEYLFDWEDNGFIIYFPQNSVEPQTTCAVFIYSSLSGQYSFPSNFELVSAVYWIEPSPSCKFKKPVIFIIHHCAAKEHRNKLSFVRANSDQSPPYKFQAHDEGILYGILSVSHFSAWAITYNSTLLSDNPVKRFYSAKLFYMGTSLQRWIIYLAITWDTDVHNKVRKR